MIMETSDTLKKAGGWLIGIRTCDPLQARWALKLGEAENWAIAIIGLITLNAVLWWIPKVGGFITTVISIALMFCVFFFVLDRRTIGIECARCGKYIETDTPWKCGFCGKENFNTAEFPFVGRCGNKECGAKPKSYQCHHCGELIYFTKDRQTIHFAKCVNTPTPTEPTPVKKDEHAEKMVELDKGIKVTELEVKKAELDVKLKQFKDVLEPVKLKSKGERLRSGVRNRTELDEEVRRLKTEADKEFPNDKDAREQRYRDIDDEARELL
jgi:hypothetical protein